MKVTSWEMLGTNLSVKTANDDWTTEAQRLLLMDRKDFNQLGIGIDDLIDAYIQTILSVIAIDKMAQRLMQPVVHVSPNPAHQPPMVFNFDLFESLNPDQVFLDEICLEL